MLSVNFVQPWMGNVYDERINESIPVALMETIEIPPSELERLNAVTNSNEREAALGSLQLEAARAKLMLADADTPEHQTWKDVQSAGGREALWRVAALPAVLILVFGGIHMRDRRMDQTAGADQEQDA